MKKPAFEIAIASVVLSTNAVAQQPVLVPINNTPQIIPSGSNNLQGSVIGISGGQNIQIQNTGAVISSGVLPVAGPTGTVTIPGSAVPSVGNVTGIITPMNQMGGGTTVNMQTGAVTTNPQFNPQSTLSSISGGMNNQMGVGTISSMSGGMNSSMKYQPNISVAQLQAQRAVSAGTVATPMGMAQAYRILNNPTTYYVLADGKVYTQ